MALLVKRDYDATTVLASATKTATGTQGTDIRLPGYVNAFAFTLDVTAAATDAADKLDVYVQTMVDGTNWVDVVHFTQCAGNGGAKRYIAKIVAQVAQTQFETGTALASGAIRNLLGDKWRTRWVLTESGPGGSGSGTGVVSFTFSVTAFAM